MTEGGILAMTNVDANSFIDDAALRCVSCGACTENCDFLRKYRLDFSDPDALREHAYHCFLCGTCTEVCPHDIDGRRVILELRRGCVNAAGGVLPETGYAMLVKEKAHYKFRNYRHLKHRAQRVLFPGCNFPSFYPETSKCLSAHFAQAGVPTVYDCCGKPIAELGLAADEQRIVREIDKRLDAAGVEELITVCPNCYYFLRPQLTHTVRSIYEVLSEYELSATAASSNGQIIEQAACSEQSAEAPAPFGSHPSVFIPCPDRASREWLHFVETACNTKFLPVCGVQCCGLGGCAAAKEPELAQGFIERVHAQCPGSVYTYCASCSGQFKRSGLESVHVLTRLLGTNELPDTAKSFVNRAKTKFA